MLFYNNHVFKGLDEHIITELMRSSSKEYFMPGSSIYKQGYKVDTVYLLLNGFVNEFR